MELIQIGIWSLLNWQYLLTKLSLMVYIFEAIYSISVTYVNKIYSKVQSELENLCARIETLTHSLVKHRPVYQATKEPIKDGALMEHRIITGATQSIMKDYELLRSKTEHHVTQRNSTKHHREGRSSFNLHFLIDS